MIGIVVSKFNSHITEKMLDVAVRILKKENMKYRVLKVAGTYEIPFGAKKLLDDKKIKGAVAIGCVIKGKTLHYKVITEWASIGSGLVSILKNKPVTFGVITADNLKQANERIISRTTEAITALLELL